MEKEKCLPGRRTFPWIQIILALFVLLIVAGVVLIATDNVRLAVVGNDAIFFSTDVVLQQDWGVRNGGVGVSTTLTTKCSARSWCVPKDGSGITLNGSSAVPGYIEVTFFKDHWLKLPTIFLN